jgi:anti-sigma regulatory factor (Ser/Thr protein kinase)
MPGVGLDLPTDLSAARHARALLRERMCPQHSGDLLERALLVLSELVVNAVEHGRPPVRAQVECRSEALHLEVSDAGPGLPRHLSPGADAGSGRGVGLVATICSAWGVREEPGRKTVWCDLRAAS